MLKPKTKYIIGIDEVGRGPLAGPVTVAAVAATVNLKFRTQNSELKLKDSKKLSPKQREAWFDYITRNYADECAELRGKSSRESVIYWAVASVSPKVIDRINISNAANSAATRAFQKLVNTHAIAQLLTKNNVNVNVKVFLDGGLYLEKSKLTNLKLKNLKTITKGDEKIPAIALASIVAKVTRDRMMKKLHKKYPKYGFDKHKGYGTKKHFKAIRKYGPSPIHRKSFRIK